MNLRTQDLEEMYHHAEREFPSECCGVVIGEKGNSRRNEVRPCKNIQHELKEKYPNQYSRDSDTGYFMDPKELKAAFDDAARQKLEVVGFYHSHPNHDAYWSEEDHRASLWGDEPSFPEAFHVVISIYHGKVKGYAAFEWDGSLKRFAQTKTGEV